MFPKKQRFSLYVILLMLVSVAGTTAIANSKAVLLLEDVTSLLVKVVHTESPKTLEQPSKASKVTYNTVATTAMYSTIIQGSDQEVGCSDQGFTVARFNLCGDFDTRLISLSGGPYANVSWQMLGGSCSPNINDDCPNTGSCYTEVGTGQTFNLNGTSVPNITGAEFRAVVDGVPYYFKAKKSTITQNFVKEDYICGVPGRIQITTLSSAYEFSIDSGSGYGAWQGPIFNNLLPGTYQVKARLMNTPNTCEYPYEPIVIEQQDLEIDVTFVDALCSGDTGSITVTANNVPGPFKYTLLNSSGVAQEFTSFISDNPYTFSTVGFGTYTVQVETNKCTGDPLNGINPPRQNLDTSGNSITIGAGSSPLDASTEVNNSFGCSNISSVDIILNTSGGSAPYTYTVNGGPVQPSFGNSGTNNGSTIYTVTTDGTYDFLITDSNNCVISASSKVETLLPPDIGVSGIDGTCSNGGAKLEFTINNGRGYNISYRQSATDPWVSTPQISVPAGTYNSIEVQYQQGPFTCTLPLNAVTVTNQGSLTGTANKIVDVTCNGTGGTIGGQIDFTGPFSGGSGSGYVFSIDGVNFTTLTSYTNLDAGTYTPIIRDSGGCRLELTPIEILYIDPPTDIDFVQSNYNCTTGTADVQLTTTSNSPIVNYAIVSPTSINNLGSNLFTGLNASNTYIFQITDANGCIYTEGFRPTVTSSIRARVKSGGDLRVCTGESDGTGTFIIDGFATSYSYEINGGLYSGGPQNDVEVVLPPSGVGTYTITVTDSDTGCTSTASFDIQDPGNLDLSGSIITSMSCDNNNIGRVEAIVTGGWGGYRYTLQYPSGTEIGPQSGTIFGNLTESTDAIDPLDVYTLTAEDSEGCTITFTFDLEERTPPSINLLSADLCYSATNTPTVTVGSSGGGVNHQYRINNGPWTSNATFIDLVPGTYIIEVGDENNCRSPLSVTIPPQVNVSLSIIDEIPCAGDGTMGITINGGDISNLATTSYTVYKDGTPVPGFSGLPMPSGSFPFIVASGEFGTYTVSISDNNGCTDVSEPIIFEAPSTIAATHNAVGPSCGDVNSGFITITPDATIGIPPYEIKFGPTGSITYDVGNNGSYAYSSQTTYSGLTAGSSYDYVVKDSRGCLIPGIITVPINPDTLLPPESTVLPVDANCSSNIVSGGVSIVSVSNGFPEFTYIIEDLFGNEITRLTTDASTVYPLNILDPTIVPGDYQVITLDARGCIDTDMVTVGSASVTIVPNTTVPLTCTPGGFNYCVDIVGGTGPFDIRLIDGTNLPYTSLGGSAPTFNRNYCFNNIQFGQVFTVEVVDTNTNCTYQEVIEVPDGSSPLDVNLSIDNATCIPGNLVGLTYNITGATGPFDIEIRNIDTGSVFVSENRTETTFAYQVPEGAYSILVYDTVSFCSDGSQANAILNSPRVDIIENVNANCNADGQLTVRGSGGDGGPYEYAFVPTGTPVDEDGTSTPTDFTDDFSTLTTVSLPGDLAPGLTYDIWVRDGRNCAYRISAAVITENPPLPTPSFVVNNQCDVTTSSFTIDLSMPASIDTPTFTLGGTSQLGTRSTSTDPWTTSFTVGSVGVYHVDVIDANGCTGFADPEVYQVLSASGGFTFEPSCTDSNGIINVTADGGSGFFDFELQDSSGNPLQNNSSGNFIGIAAGNYQVLVTDTVVTDGSVNCFFTVENIISTIPTPPMIISDGASDISCYGVNDGSINIILSAGSDADGIASYHLYTGALPLPTSPVPTATNDSGSFNDLLPGTYVAQVVTNKGCTDEVEVTIQQPDPFSISASAPDFSCVPGANRYSSTIITVATVEPGTIGSGYQYSITGFSNYQTGNTFEIVDNGSQQDITVYAIDGNGCMDSFTLPTIQPPSDVMATIIEVDALNCRDDERVRIEVTGTSNFTVNTLSAIPVASVTNSSSNNYVDVYLGAPGDFLFEIIDNITGCIYPMPLYTVNQPEIPMVTIAEAKPVSCAVPGNDGELFIALNNYVGLYSYTVYFASDTARTSPLANGTFNTADFPDINGNQARISGLPGGNLIVDISSTTSPYCSGISNVANIRTPNGPLNVSAISIGNVGCTNDTGEIEAIGSGGWDNAPYEYRLLQSTDGGLTYTTEIVPFSTDNVFTTLSFGLYQIEIRDSQFCSDTIDIELEEVAPILAGIREPQGLDCPNGNNAILEAYDTTSGDSITALAGASGGISGAGYNYRLLYLNSTDVTDVVSSSGLQNTPTFVGDSGGYLSEGWYAIEVSSSFGCISVTDAYYVDPPPPIQPLLVQTRVPGCGGDGEMRLTIENPDASYMYEFQRVENGIAIGSYEPLNGTSLLISGIEGITYQFDVRKVNSSSTCLAIRSNGITMTNATGVTLLPNLPDDISCASELDGRIESFINGGVGNDQFYLYEGDPVDAFNPSPAATLLRGPLPEGTFEGLPEGSNFFIAVTSGTTCMDIAGPFEIIRPDPIVFEANPTPISCNGGEDGTIAVEVVSGGVGTVQFAIGPNFNEFFSDPNTPGAYTFDGLSVGTYEILIQDENGCIEKDFIEVLQPNELLVVNIETTPELCVGANDGTAVFDIIGGTPFNDPLVSSIPYYEYKVEMVDPVDETGTGVFGPYLGQGLQNLQGGATYAVYVQDLNECSTLALFTVGIGVELNPELEVDYGCDGIFPTNTTAVLLEDDSVLEHLMFALDPVDPTDAITAMATEEFMWGDLPAGEHTVFVYHENGCSSFIEFTIDQYDPLALEVIKTGANEITAVATGGFGSYTYFFNNESYGENNVFTAGKSGNVSVKVIDARGCLLEFIVPFEFTGMLEFPNFFTPDGDNLNDVWSPNNKGLFDNVDVKIYDRYGRVVANLAEVSGWDGTYDGNEVPTGDYWYVVTANNNEYRYVGHFTLYR